jgi:hypothetical protein
VLPERLPPTVAQPVDHLPDLAVGAELCVRHWAEAARSS